jgi:undecaprenyl-diphosphatase
MTLLQVMVLAIVQGLAELLPVSSSAHVVVVEKLLGLDPSSPPMTLLLVMLHTGTMFAVILYFWREWRAIYFHSAAACRSFAVQVVIATALTGVIGLGIAGLIEKTVFRGVAHAQIEDLFGHLEFIAPALAAAGVLILIAAFFEKRRAAGASDGARDLDLPRAAVIGTVQGLCLPFRGLSRSGATISTGMLLGITKIRAEAFSFALAVVLTPPVVAREALRLAHDVHAGGSAALRSVALLTVFGAVLALLAGLLALRWLSRWLQAGRWYLFGIYCLAAAVAVTFLHRAGY